MSLMKPGRFGQIVRSHLRSVRRDVGLAALCVVGSAAAALAAPWPLKLIVDHVLLARPLPGIFAPLTDRLQPGSNTALVVLALSLVAIAGCASLFAYLQLYLTSRIGLRLVYRLRSELFDHLQSLSLSFHNRARTGDLLNKLTSDTNMLKDVYAESALSFANGGLTILGVFAVMLALNWQLALIVLATFPVLFIALLQVLKRVRRSARQQRKHEGRMASRLGELLGAVSVVQAFGREAYERERFESESAQSMEETMRSARMEAAATRLVEIVSAAGASVVLLFGGMQALSGVLSPGDLLVFASYVGNLYRPARGMARLSARFSRAGASVERLSEMLDIEPDIRDAPGAIEARGLRGEIAFERVDFAYDGGEAVLREVSFRIPAGSRVALVGASGAGKSTVANLVLRLYEPQRGRVLIDGVDVRCYRRESLRREVGVVLQEALLFGTTLRENIAYGKPDASDEEIEGAACAAGAHEFVAALPEGYETVVGERGAGLSGGQRQRIALARALAKRPSLLIMDEPTSALDAESEALIGDALRRVHKGRTTLLIAHRLESVRDADLILVLRDGKVVEQGTHEALAARGGYYCELFCIAPTAAQAALRVA
ncbi:MAG: ABC transporter ATP-binding protein [Betaproteobacteria bacterium]|nr:ABC transporter ATP-binding protein [Betaproteobacteria bacterium]